MKATSPEQIYFLLQEFINNHELSKIEELFDIESTFEMPEILPPMNPRDALLTYAGYFESHNLNRINISVERIVPSGDDQATAHYLWRMSGSLGDYGYYNGEDEVEKDDDDGYWRIKHCNAYIPIVETTETIENSVLLTINNLRKLIVECELIRLEIASLTDLTLSLGSYHRVKFPVINARLSDDDVRSKWSDVLTRYHYSIKGLEQMFVTKHKLVSDLMELAGSEISKLNKPLNLLIIAGIEELNEYAEELKSITLNEDNEISH